MTPRRIILGLIVLTVAVFCLVAARKLMATPKYDRVQVGMSKPEAGAVLGSYPGTVISAEWSQGETLEGWQEMAWFIDEGELVLRFHFDQDGGMRLVDKRITPRGPLERLAWLVGWR